MEMGWLSDLEEKVRRASEELGALRQENRELHRRVQDIEDVASRQDRELAVAWEAERAEIRRRVERIAQGLADLLEA